MLNENNVNENLIQSQVTIPSGQTTSNSINTRGASLVAIDTPSVLTGANITFEVTNNTGVFKPYVNVSGTVVTIPVLVDQHIGILSTDFVPVEELKIVSDLAEADDRVFILTLRPI